MLVSEDLALILTDNESGRMVASHAIRYGLAGAILCDLALQNFALVSHDEGGCPQEPDPGDAPGHRLHRAQLGPGAAAPPR